MWPTSHLFLQTIAAPRKVGTTVTVTTPGGSPKTLNLVSGSWQFTSGQTIRRTAALVVEGGLSTYRMLSTPGTTVQILHGFRWAGGAQEYVPVITGELSSAATQYGDGTCNINLADFGQRLTRATYLTAYSPPVTASRVATITAAIGQAVPTATVTSTATDAGNVSVANTWTSRADLVADLATDGNAEGYFLPDGNYRIRNLPKVTDSATYLIKNGVGGTLTGFARNRPLDRLYNTVIVQPASSDGSQTWTQQIAQIADTNNPRHPNYIGVSPYTWTAPTVMSAGEALAVAQALLTKVQGSTETLALDVISHPGLDAGDVLRITDPEAGTIVNHIIDSGTGDLGTGAMSLATRAAVETLT